MFELRIKKEYLSIKTLKMIHTRSLSYISVKQFYTIYHDSSESAVQEA